jgi:hypothetical protein
MTLPCAASPLVSGPLRAHPGLPWIPNSLHEVNHTLFFFERTIFETVARFYHTFDAELARHYPGVKRSKPFLTFASWVGGDRDGHPYVTPESRRRLVRIRRRLTLAATMARRPSRLTGLGRGVATEEAKREGPAVGRSPGPMK